MAGIIPGPLVTAPESVGRRYGLFAGAAGPIDLSPHGAGGGVRYVPVTCGGAHLWPIDVIGGVPGATEKLGDPGDDVVEAAPILVYASYECGSIGYTSREFMDKVLRRLAAGEQGAVEFALWTGRSDVDGTDLGIPNLQDSGVGIVVADETDITMVLAAMEDWAYREQGYGGVAYIHAPVSVAAQFSDHSLMRLEGGLWRTALGTVIIFGGGYPGTGADGEVAPVGGSYLYITGQTTVYRAPDPYVYPVPQTLDKATNQYFLLAEREYVVAFDCMAGRALFNPLGGS